MRFEFAYYRADKSLADGISGEVEAKSESKALERVRILPLVPGKYKILIHQCGEGFPVNEYDHFVKGIR